MKCKVIEDLLPMYIDKVCNKETSLEIEEHLKSCSKCTELYKTMSSQITNIEMDSSNIDNNLKEKDLLLNAKKTIKFEFVKKNLKKIFHWVIRLNLLLIFIEFLIITFGYQLEYPRIFFGSLDVKTYLILLIAVIFPTLFSIFGTYILKRFNNINHYIGKSMLLVIPLLISIPISFLNGLCLFMIPPVESYTDSTKNYLIVSDDLHKRNEIFEFFPQEIPEDATDVQYSYRKYMGLFDTDVTISASWSLPVDSYNATKQLISDTYSLQTISYDTYRLHPKNTNSSNFVDLNFKYDDKTNTVTYIATYKK